MTPGEVPDDFTHRERIVAEALYADEWTKPNPAYGAEWHKRFPWWMCVAAARIAVPALDKHDDIADDDPGPVNP